MVRPVSRILPTIKTLEGGGFVVRRPFPVENLSYVDPFLLFDHFGPVDYAPGQAKGAPAHPHRGFETVTYVLEGRMQHEDSAGHAGELGPGDVQWMTAGHGIVHDEMPHADVLRDGGRVHGLQLWVNLPRADKLMQPRYQEVPAARIPEATTPDGLARVRVIAGEALGVSAVIDTRTPILYHHWSLSPGASIETPVPADWNVLAYALSGRFELGGKTLVEGQMAVLGAGDAFAAKGEGELILLGGKPLGEPVARYGPFVMNFPAEIKQAMIDYQEGRMGSISAR
jgi:redox-sensitive bicupin YhaK (pirin superfamily)